MKTWKTLGTAITLSVLATSCSQNGSQITQPTVEGFDNPGECVVIDIAVSSEKIDLLTNLAKDFNATTPKIANGACVFVRPQKKASGAAATLLSSGWTDPAEGPPPVIWSPSASSWGAIVNQRLADVRKSPIVPTTAQSFMVTPLVIAMPKPMADALKYPAQPVGWADVLKLSTDPTGWASVGHPEWGPFRLGKTNPNYSTSGLNALIAQTYAGAGTSALSLETLNDPKVAQFSKGIESSVVHYGDITMTFLNNWFRADRRGTALTYASAVAIEEKSLIDYNRGNPDGVLDAGEEPRAPRIPLVAVYPKEGTLYSDNPFFVLNADWVSEDEKAGAALFGEYVQRPENQAKVIESGFRPGNPAVPLAAPVSADNGVDPNQPQSLLKVPEPQVMIKLLDAWAQNRKTARVVLSIDVSGSMGEDADGSSTKLDLAKQAAIDALDLFNDADEVGLQIFSTGLGPAQDQKVLELVPVGPIGAQREAIARAIDGLVPTNGTPLFDVAEQSYDDVAKGYDPSRINAVILLTDGRNDDGNKADDVDQKEQLLAKLRSASSGENSKPIRLFTVGYGADADQASLKAMAEASNGAAYDASNPKSISKILTQVVSNF